jgi:hypothetical protein
MSSYFAKIERNIVQNVVVANSADWCSKHLGGTWVETFHGNISRTYAGIGYTYFPQAANGHGDFLTQFPKYPSWVPNINGKLRWEAPAASISDNAHDVCNVQLNHQETFAPPPPQQAQLLLQSLPQQQTPPPPPQQSRLPLQLPRPPRRLPRPPRRQLSRPQKESSIMPVKIYRKDTPKKGKRKTNFN